jgi:hypothetical protein
MTETANALYLATQRHWRARRESEAANEPTASSRVAVEEQYQKTRNAGFVIEKRLQILFADGEARKKWHAAMDLLTIVHYQVIGTNKEAKDQLLKINAGLEHSLVTFEELQKANQNGAKKRKILLDHYRAWLDDAISAVLKEHLRPIHKISQGAVIAEHPDPELYPE